MSRISYNKLALKFSNKVKTIDINGNQVEVLQYLPISDKNDLIYAVLDKSNYNGVYNEVLLDMYFYFDLVLLIFLFSYHRRYHMLLFWLHL